jgi:hypothetical protein
MLVDFWWWSAFGGICDGGAVSLIAVVVGLPVLG